MSHTVVRFAHQREFNQLNSTQKTQSAMAARQFQRKEQEASFCRQAPLPTPSVFTTHFAPTPTTSQDMFAREATIQQKLSPRQRYNDRIHGGSRMAGVVYNPREEDCNSKQISSKRFKTTFGKRSNGDCQRLKNSTLRDLGNFHDPPIELSAYNYPRRGKPIAEFKKLRDAEASAPKFQTTFYPHLHTTAQDLEGRESRIHQQLSPRQLYDDKKHANGIKNFDHNPPEPSRWVGRKDFNANFGKATVVYDSNGLKQATCFNQADDWTQHNLSTPKLQQVPSSPLRVKKSAGPKSISKSLTMMMNSKSMNALAEYDRLSKISKQQRGLTGGMQAARVIPRSSMNEYSEYSAPLTQVDIQMRSELDKQRYTIRTPSMLTGAKSLAAPEFGSSLLRNSGQSQLSYSS